MNPGAGPVSWAPTDEQLAALGFVASRVIAANPTKRSAVLGGTWREQPAVLKWVSSDAPKAALEAVGREREAYEAGQPGAAAVLLAAGAGHLILAEAPGESLRSVLWAASASGDARAFLAATDSALEMVRSVYAGSFDRVTGGIEDVDGLLAAGLHLQRDMLRSGPLGIRRSATARVVGRSLDAVCRAGTRRIIRRAARREGLARVGWAHGDLHLDNLRVAPTGEVGMIDFGTSSATGFPVLDVAYLAAAIAAAAAGRPDIERHVRDRILRCLRELTAAPHPLLEVVAHFTELIRTNPRFAPGLDRASLLRARSSCAARCAAAAFVPVRLPRTA